MRYSSETNAWVFARPKDAVLYFDKAHIFVDRVLEGADEVESLRELGGKFLDDVDDKLGIIPAPNVFLLNPVLSELQEVMVRKFFSLQGSPTPEPPVHPGDPLYDVAKSIFFANLAVQAEISGKGSLVIPSGSTNEAQGDEPCLTLTGLRLVDTSKMSWKHLLELREDSVSVQKLRNLRLFLSKEYGDAEPDRIRDDLQKRLEEHEAAAQKWGADLRDACLSLMFGKEVQLSAAAASGLLFAGRYYEAISAGVPVLLQLGKVALEISSRRRDYAFKASNDPIAYLVDLRKSGR